MGNSGIAKYSRDFYRLILKDKGYVFIDSANNPSAVLSMVSSRDHVHIELGIFQKNEIEILFRMLRSNYKNVAVTLHDAPLIKYPYHEFKNSFLNNLSKFYDIYVNGFGSVSPYVKKIKLIYVLSKRGLEAVKRKYKVDNIHYLPHVVDPDEIVVKEKISNHNFLYFGFIGRNKGLEYSLRLHQEMLSVYPEIMFYVVGKPLGKEKQFYDSLRDKYKKNVVYLGFIPEDQLQEIFDQTTFALLPFRKYKFFWPFSGSILYSMKKGKIVLTKNVNTVPEIIKNGKTGFYLSGKLRNDREIMTRIIEDAPLLYSVKDEGYKYLLQNHSVDIVKQMIKD